MIKPSHLLGAAAILSLSGCANYDIGSHNDPPPSGSYEGETLNSPVADQNPHPGGDSSYPASVSDQGKEPTPPEKSDGQ